MKLVIEHYGLSLLEMLGVVGALVIVFGCIQAGGIISDFVAKYMITLCG